MISTIRQNHRLRSVLMLVLVVAAGVYVQNPLPAIAVPVPAPAAAQQSGPLVVAVDSVGMTVRDMDRSVDFFTRILTFEKVSDVELTGPEFERLVGVFGARARVVRLKLGDEFIELTEYLAPRGRPIPADARSNDRWFQHVAIIVRDMDAAYKLLRQHNVAHASTGPQTLPEYITAAAGIRAFYFKDPDGHALEILQFPAGKGDAKWQRKDKLFLGIDHTAIVVADTDASLRFYHDVLGFRVPGESENYGPEQEHLNNVFGARLRITGLRAPGGGPGVEFLEYLAPRDGRPTPLDLKANDLLHWQTKITVKSADDVQRATRTARPDGTRAAWVSPGTVSLPDARAGFRRGLMLRDADGHALLLVE